MLNPLNFLSKFIKSSNQRELDRIDMIVKKINTLEESIKKLEDTDFPKKTLKLKEKIKKIKERLENNLPTVPTILADEIECNIFLKAKDLKSFSKLRDLKDNF